MATTEETLAKLRASFDEIVERGLAGETYNGHSEQFIAPSELIRAERQLEKRKVIENATASGAGVGLRRLRARFTR